MYNMNNDVVKGDEADGFMGGGPKYRGGGKQGCCHSKHTRNCCVAIAVFGALFVAFGVAVLLVGKPLLEKKIAKSMALTPASERLESWLQPPVQPYMQAYAFHLKNPDEVLKGKKPHVEEIGPFVYRSDTLKDTDENMAFSNDNKHLTYRPRKMYYYDAELSSVNPEKTYVTVPNIPYWTGLNKARKSGFTGGYIRSIVTDPALGLAKPFINVTLAGLLWGYHDELPCFKETRPSSCQSILGGPEEEESGGIDFGDDDEDDGWGDDDFGFGDDDEDGFGFGDEDDGFGLGGDTDESGDTFGEFDSDFGGGDDISPVVSTADYAPPKDSPYEKMVKPKAEFVDCKCQWGLFRDRNVTMRKPSTFMTGLEDLATKGVMVDYDGKKTLDWWKPGSTCDKVKGNDGSTLPPGLNPESKIDIWIALMCRTLRMTYEKDTEHAGIKTLRFIPARNAMGSHDDPNEEARNDDNACYCMADQDFTCFKSGVMNMEPCKRDTFAPLALSNPHFYQADPSYTQAVRGLSPSKEKHEFYMDIVPQFGFPLAIQPKFQLNLIIGRDDTVPALANMENQIVLPFLWAQVGFSEPSAPMAKAIQFGLDAPNKLPLLGAVVCFVLGGMLLLAALGYFVWRRRNTASDGANLEKTNVQMVDIKPKA